MNQKVGVVIPTLFRRNEYLRECIESVRSAGDVYLMLLGPRSPDLSEFEGLIDEFVEEPHSGSLASKLDFALRSLPPYLHYLTWIGDDDLLEPGSIDRSLAVMEANSGVVMTFGACRYIDAKGDQLGINNSGNWAIWLMRFGPFLAPQPGSLYHREAYIDCGGLDHELSLAFDYDLAMNLLQVGTVYFIDHIQSSFRWHSDSLSVKSRTVGLLEAESIRRRYATKTPARYIVRSLNPLITFLAKVAAKFLSLRIARLGPLELGSPKIE